MDESSGRAMARNLKIRITGTLGVLLKAKRDGSHPAHLENQASCH
jgi:predicted nucleic acid-binding protein